MTVKVTEKPLKMSCVIAMLVGFGLISTSCAPAKLLRLCHNDNPYICDAKADPNDPKRVTIGIDCLDALLTDIERFNAKRDQ